MDKIRIGEIGEEIATRLLVRRGLTIVTRNYRKKFGEIDIIAHDGEVLRFVEVKSFSREMVDHRPEENVHDLKIEKIGKTGDFFMKEYNVMYMRAQIDMIAVVLDIPRRRAYCKVLENI